MLDTHQSPTAEVHGFVLSCPFCQVSLPARGSTATCPVCGNRCECSGNDWRLREQHYNTFIQRVLAPLEKLHAGRPGNRVLKILVLGAGNGWLANRLCLRGHNVSAIDINVDPLGGLAVIANHQRQCLALQAEFDHLPFASGQFDLVIFNGSFHYSSDYQVSLHEAMRNLSADGLLIILDTPVVPDESSSRNYIHPPAMQELARSSSLSWQLIWPAPALKVIGRNLTARIRSRRPPAQFPIILVGVCPAWKPARARRILSRLYESFLRWRYHFVDQPRMLRVRHEKVHGLSLQVHPGVFNPRVFHSGLCFASILSQELIPAGSSVMDMGTGTGIAAIVAATWAARVLAVDINPQAVACASANIAAHHLTKLVEVATGDLFTAAGSERFDVVLFNPPFLWGKATNAFEQAFFSTDIAERFAAGLSEHLQPDGYALLLLSSKGDTAAFLQALRWHGYRVAPVAHREWVNERFTLYQALRLPGTKNRGAVSHHDHLI